MAEFMDGFSVYFPYFFTYQDGLPKGAGYSLFGKEHILWMAFCFACIAGFLMFDGMLEKEKRPVAEKAVGFLPAVLLLLRLALLSFMGKMSVYELPLHLCSMAAFLCALHVFVKWDWLSQVLYTLCLPGAVAAVIFPDGTYYPAIHFITFQSFLLHTGIIAYVLSQLAGAKLKPAPASLWKPFLFLLLTVPPVYLFDKKFDANYMFVNVPSKGSPLKWLASFMGNPGYLLGYGILVSACMILMDAGYVLVIRCRNGRNGKSGLESESPLRKAEKN